MQLIENDNRRDFLEALFDYNDDVRAVLVNNRGLLIETAVVNGSWQSTYTILAHCMLMRREEVLAELMIGVIYQAELFRIDLAPGPATDSISSDLAGLDLEAFTRQHVHALPRKSM